VTPPLTYDVYVQPGPTGAPVFMSVVGTSTVKQVNDIHIAPNGLVFWYNYSAFLFIPAVSDSVDVTFDDPTHVAAPLAALCDPLTLFELGALCGAGNISLPPLDQATYGGDAPYFAPRIRQFPDPGIYPFHSTRLGVSGRVIVNTDLAD
jgi:hypothetical protein